MYTTSVGNGGARFLGRTVKTRRVVGTMDKVRVLIIDDSSVMRKIVERSLRQAGLELEKVVEAANGAEALAAKGVPIVMITTEGSESRVVAALSAGARGYIRKPFTPDQVKEHVLSLLGRKP